MNLAWRARGAGELDYGLIYGTIAILALVAVRLLPLSAFLPPCAFKAVTGFPCPACGSTRSLACLAQGDIAASMAMNPLFFLLIIAAIGAFVVNGTLRLCRLPLPSMDLTAFEADCIRVAAVLVVLANWAFLAAHR